MVYALVSQLAILRLILRTLREIMKRHCHCYSISTFADKFNISLASSHFQLFHWLDEDSRPTFSELGYEIGKQVHESLLHRSAGGAPIADLKHEEPEAERRNGV